MGRNWYDPIDAEEMRRAIFPNKARPSTPEYDHDRETIRRGWFGKLNPDHLIKNEVEVGNGKIFAKIPKIKGRIYRRKKGNDYYIELLTERVYNPEKQQTRNKRSLSASI